jgi:hypothetical protein
VAYRLGRLRVHDPEIGPLELQGDGYAAAGELVTLVAEPGVQRWLGMTADEAREAVQVVDAYRQEVSAAYASGEWLPPHRHAGAGQARAKAEARIATLLGDDRARRLARVSRRLRGADSLLDEDVAAAIGLSAAQRQALLAAMDENEAARAQLFRELRPLRLESPADLEERGKRDEESGAERLFALITAPQREAFERLRA